MGWFGKAGNKSVSGTDDWRRRADPEDLREYDAFGPWIFEVRSDAEMPKRFRPYYAEHRHARYLIKLPINLDRRAAQPGMDLYHAVIAIHDDGAVVLRLQDGQVAASSVTWPDVVAVRCYTNLLLGRWSLLLCNGDEVNIDYNTVSSRLIDSISEFIRARCFWPAPIAENRLEVAPVPVVDPLFQYHQSVARRIGPQPAVVVHYEAKNQPCRNAAKKRRRTTGLMLVDGPNELTIVADDPPERHPFRAHFSVCSTFVAYARITSFSVSPPSTLKPPQFQTLTLYLDKQTIRQRCLVIPETVLALLRSRGIAQVEAA